MKDRRLIKTTGAFILLAVCFFLLFGLNVYMGSVRIPLEEILKMMMKKQAGLPARHIIMDLRIPRALSAAVLGGALAVSGYLLQIFFHNPLAGPYIMGISSGAKLCVGLAMIAAARHAQGVSYLSLMLAAFFGALLVTALILLAAAKIRGMATLLVIGIMVGSICSAITDFMVTMADDAHAASLHAWSMGSFSGMSWRALQAAIPTVMLAVAGAFLLGKPIAAYALGDAYARSMGVNLRLFRVALIGLSCILSACVTALTGPISFVGVAVPHLARQLLRKANPHVLIPAVFLLGADFCMLSDLIARTAFAPTELAISTVTSFLGAPVVIALMLQRASDRSS